MTEELKVIKRCAACRKEKPVSEMKVCMHAQMHNYVCDSKCMNDFYNPPKKPAQLTSQGGEAVAMRQRFSQIEDEIMAGKHTAASVFTQMRTAALYTHPADQVAEPDAELVELLRSKFPRIDPCKPVPLDEKAHCCEYTIYVERERLHRMIDALLAKSEGVKK